MSTEFITEIIKNSEEKFEDLKTNKNLNNLMLEIFGGSFSSGYIPRKDKSDYVILVKLTDLIIGFTLVQENFDLMNTSYISGVCVHPEFRKRGIATTMLSIIVENEKANNKNMILHVDIEDDAEYIVSFYEKFKFEKVFETENEYQFCNFSSDSIEICNELKEIVTTTYIRPNMFIIDEYPSDGYLSDEYTHDEY